jgi:histidinol phosphatase-like enzyme (inositol monophosphatase family)
MDLAPLRSFIGSLATESGAVIRPYFANPDLAVELKADETPVTVADRQAEQTMRRMIGQRFPDHGIIGEEYGADRPDAEFVWALDPIDGTKSFATGCPLFGTLICLLRNGQPVLGAIHQPILGQLCIGDGQSCTLNGRPIRCRSGRPLSAATLLTTDFLSIGSHQPQAGFDRLLGSVKMARTWGDCYGYLLLASGFADLMLDPVMNPWDLLALVPIVRGAGGTITDWQGRDPVSANSIVAANADLHEQVIEMLNARR